MYACDDKYIYAKNANYKNFRATLYLVYLLHGRKKIIIKGTVSLGNKVIFK